MRAHHRFYAIASLMLCTVGAAEARPVNARFFLDGAAGVSVPIADSVWRDDVSPTFVAQLRLGGELWLTRRFGLGPEFALSVSPVIPNLPGGPVTDARIRGLVGVRLLVGFGRGHAFFARFMLGVDAIAPHGETRFGVEPGIGMQFHVARHCVVGFAVDFPTAVHNAFVGGVDSPIQVDIDFLFFVGLRI
jgi:hypothetical protein